jgi:ribonuclease HI
MLWPICLGMNESNDMRIIFCDGACSGNPGPGAWAYIVFDNDQSIASGCGAEEDTTNNRMELMAAIKAIEAFDNCIVIVDSQYVKNGITQWIHKWELKNWKTSDGQIVKNMDLWQKLHILNQRRHVEWKWERGHSGGTHDIVDDLARRSIVRN